MMTSVASAGVSLSIMLCLHQFIILVLSAADVSLVSWTRSFELYQPRCPRHTGVIFGVSPHSRNDVPENLPSSSACFSVFRACLRVLETSHIGVWCIIWCLCMQSSDTLAGSVCVASYLLYLCCLCLKYRPDLITITFFNQIAVQKNNILWGSWNTSISRDLCSVQLI